MHISKNKNGYAIDNSRIDSLSSITGSIRAVKKPLEISALQINEPFSVETTEGKMRGKAGDWLMEGVKGEFYICPNDIFKASYDILEKTSS